MATPSKSFVEPSGLSRLGASSATFKATSRIGKLRSAYMAIGFFPSPRETRIFAPGARSPLNLVDRVRSKIPPPPMGRLLLVTFPSIYKERNSTTTTRSKPIIGQIFPDPMSSLHLWADAPTTVDAGRFWP